MALRFCWDVKGEEGSVVGRRQSSSARRPLMMAMYKAVCAWRICASFVPMPTLLLEFEVVAEPKDEDLWPEGLGDVTVDASSA